MRILYAAHGFPPNQSAGAEWRAHRTVIEARRRGHHVTVFALDPVPDQPPGEWSLLADEVDAISVSRLTIGVSGGLGRREEFDQRAVFECVRNMIEQGEYDIVHLISGYLLGGNVIEAASDLGVPVVVTLTDFWFLCPRISLRKRTGELCTVPRNPMECVLCLANEKRRYRIPYKLTGGAYGRALIRTWENRIVRPRAIEDLSQGMVARRSYLGEMLRRADRLIAPSRFLHDVFAAQDFPTSRMLLMRQGLDVEGWTPVETAVRRPSEMAASLTIGFIGQLTESKGVADLVAAIRKMPVERSLTVRLYGEFSSAFPAFRREIEAAVGSDPRIELKGRFDNRLIRWIHADLDVLVVPSRWYENSPNVILEAFACGTPVIAADLGGMAELVTDGENGLLFPAGNVDALGACIARIIDEPDLLPRLASRMPRVKSIAEEMVELEQVYAEAIADRRRRAG